MMRTLFSALLSREKRSGSASLAVTKKRWLAVVSGLLVLAAVVYLKRDGLERAVIAFRIWHARVFTSPPMSDESVGRRLADSALFYWDFAGFVIDRDRRLKQFKPALKPLVEEIVRRQSSGEGMQYSMHIYREVRWLLNFTADVKDTEAEIAELRHSLTLPPSQQLLATEQQPLDGSWGLGFTSWYLRLYYSVDHVNQCQGNPRYPLSFLDRINSPENLTAVLDADLMDNFATTRVFNEERLNETFSALARLLFGHQQRAATPFILDSGPL